MATLVSYALCTVADVKESLGIASSDTTKDNLITRKINQVTDQIENYCQRRFELTQYSQEEYNASNTDVFILKQRPVVVDDTHTFTAEWRTTTLNDSVWETIDSQLYFVDNNSGVIENVYTAFGYWRRYRFSYWAGYATIPNDLAEAASTLACYYVNNASTNNSGVQQIKEGEREQRFFQINNFYNIMQDLGIDAIIDSYANEAILADR